MINTTLEAVNMYSKLLFPLGQAYVLKWIDIITNQSVTVTNHPQKIYIYTKEWYLFFY